MTFTLAEPNPFERATLNATKAVQMARTDPAQAKEKFLVAQRRGTLDPTLASVESSLFPTPEVDPYAWADEVATDQP